MVSLIDKQVINQSKQSFSHFLKHVFVQSYKKDKFRKSPHTWNWAQRIQSSKRTATLSARRHLKSTTMYAYVMWMIFNLKEDETVRWLYMSYNQKMSVYHTENIKQLIQANPFFSNIKDQTTGSSLLDYSWGNNRFICSPSGILTFNRGWHGQGVICDDILQDPSSELNLTVIDKITRIFMEQVMSLPIEGGEVHLVGTAQHQQDLFFQLQKNTSWNWAEYKAILNEANQEVLWPELFTFERLVEIRSNELGEKAFNKEYMCSPVWAESAYFQRTEILNVVDSALEECKRPASEWKEKMRVVAGLDIGKKTHPSHLGIFSERSGTYTLLFEKFMDGWDYSKQVDFINGLIKFYLIDELRYDDTRAELEGFRERRIIDSRIWKPITFKVKTKFDMASNFSRLVHNKKIVLLNRQRMIDSILSVTNDLQAIESEIGHGDAFWSLSLALFEVPSTKGYIAV